MVDLTFLEKFTKGNADKKIRYISLYLDVAPKTISQMKKNLEESDFDQLRINAHSLKPQADFMGIPALKKVLIEIEIEINSGNYTNLETLYNNAISINQEATISLKESLSNLTDQA